MCGSATTMLRYDAKLFFARRWNEIKINLHFVRPWHQANHINKIFLSISIRVCLFFPLRIYSLLKVEGFSKVDIISIAELEKLWFIAQFPGIICRACYRCSQFFELYFLLRKMQTIEWQLSISFPSDQNSHLFCPIKPPGVNRTPRLSSQKHQLS